MPDEPNGDWREHRLLILAELKRISDSILSLEARLDDFRSEEIQKIKVDIAMLQVKSGIWAGIVSGIISLAVVLFKLIK
jgi:hypothetical protein